MQGYSSALDTTGYVSADQCSSNNTAPNQWVIPRPSPRATTIFENTNRDSLPFLRAAEIEKDSKEHKELKTTIQALFRQYLHPFKYLEEQGPGCVDQLIERARTNLPWLDKYEDCWPARIYLKRYVDARRPHLKCTKYARLRTKAMLKSKVSNDDPEDSGDMLGDCGSVMRDFLHSLRPNLEHHMGAFVKLGIKDQETLQAFLSWPCVVQTQFLDDGHEVLQLTSLERTGLLVGCGLLTQKALQTSLERIVKPGRLHR